MIFFFEMNIFFFLDIVTLHIYFLIIQKKNFRGDLSDSSAKTETLVRRLQSGLAALCLHTNYVFIINMNNYQDDLNHVSAKKKSLYATVLLITSWSQRVYGFSR